MDVMFARCAGLDVHKKTIVACVLIRTATESDQVIQTFGTTTGELRTLADWLADLQVTHVAMESTGSYWKPVFNVLEDRFTTWLVNPAHMKAVPGRKTDVKDSAWIAQLLQHGLLQPSFIPDRAQRELRELTRYRKSLIEERAREANRIQKVLEGANIKLGSVISDVLGVSGTRILQALAHGETDPAQWAALADDRLRATPDELARALDGLIGPHQQFLLTAQLQHLTALDHQIATLDGEVAQRLAPFADMQAIIESHPGIGRRTAETVLSEIGPTVDPFPSSSALSKWVGIAPGNHESAGKRLSGRTTPGNRILRAAVIEAAQAAGRTKATYVGAQYRRMVRTKGAKRAAVIVAHTIVVDLWYMLKRGQPYVDLGVEYFDQRDHDRVTRQAVKRLEGLGYQVTLSPAS